MHEFNWGLLIVVYLFLGGLSAGLFFAAGLANYLTVDDKPVYARIARMGALLAPWPVAVGSGLLILDLGNWYRFYKLFTHFRWESPMSIGSYLLSVFTAITFAYLFSWLTAEERAWLFGKVPASWKLMKKLYWPVSVSIANYVQPPLVSGKRRWPSILTGCFSPLRPSVNR